MAGRVALDTTFLIDLQRERARGDAEGAAHRFLAADPGLELHLSTVALGEFAEGFEDEDHPVLRVVRELHVLLPVDEATALTYGGLTRGLRRQGRLIGTNDLWIAAASVRHGLPLVTANPAEFGRVNGLQVVAYR
ncbi:MAG: type II toxin-antitoxin system VapC family toxin [Gemmatimonadetes bacterium]|nr:type II toxin-antitoxin system VapC family toxin [Gemmatimonadota bacterium]